MRNGSSSAFYWVCIALSFFGSVSAILFDGAGSFLIKAFEYVFDAIGFYGAVLFYGLGFLTVSVLGTSLIGFFAVPAICFLHCFFASSYAVSSDLLSPGLFLAACLPLLICLAEAAMRASFFLRFSSHSSGGEHALRRVFVLSVFSFCFVLIISLFSVLLF